MMKKQILLIAMLIAPMAARAVTVEVDGVNYNLLTLSRGETNGDGTVVIGDIVEITNIMTGKE